MPPLSGIRKPRGKPFEKGRKKTGGRPPGGRNHINRDMKAFLLALIPAEELRERWMFFWNHKNVLIRWRAFEFYHHYLYGKPIMIVQSHQDAPPVNINISAIPTFHKPAPPQLIEALDKE